MREGTATKVNRGEEGRAEGTDWNYETRCLGGLVSVQCDKKRGTLTDTNFVTVGQCALGFKGPVGDIATNVKHGWKE